MYVFRIGLYLVFVLLVKFGYVLLSAILW